MATCHSSGVPAPSAAVLLERLSACQSELSAIARCLASLCGDGPVDASLVSRIIEAVCDHYQVSAAELKGVSRARQISEPRHIACYLMRVHAGRTFNQIGNDMMREHTSVISACRRVERDRNSVPDFARTIEHLEWSLGLCRKEVADA